MAQIKIAQDYADDVFEALTEKPLDHDGDAAQAAVIQWIEEAERGSIEYAGDDAWTDAQFIHDTDRYWE